ncbi:MAG: lytic transglycosylase domain-containing protein [Synergistaceae bacterium]|nr:lytic transglycosylase domain-containing protein [Synergistaceae bacterium]
MTRRIILCTVIFMLVLTSSSHAAQNLRDLFWARNWPLMEQQYKSQKVKTARDHALMANAYRFQERWQEAVSIVEAQSKNFPAGVKPYADMMRVLGYERLGQTQKALTISESLYKNAPADLKYYVALAQYRLYNLKGDTRNTINALIRMLSNANTDERKIYTLKLLVPLSRKAEHALQLLDLQAGSKEAAEVLSGIGKPGNNIRVAMGVYQHTAGNNQAALEWLNGATGRKAQYYRAWANSRLKNNDAALNLWGSLAISGNSYAGSSVTRIANLAKDKGMREKSINVLERIARERRGSVQARALQALVNLYGKANTKRRDELEAQILRSFPNTNYAQNVLWSRAWRNIDAGNFAEAVKLFRQSDAPGVPAYKRARILYWLEFAQRKAGQTGEADATLALLRRKYPLTIYGLISGAEIRIVDGLNPDLNLKPSELEEFGFINNAYIRLSRPKASTRELYRAIYLSRWLGLEDSYQAARQIENLMTSRPVLYRQDLEALYPRPYRATVEAAAKQYGTESNFVWAIMRQESAFKPDARSYVGAAGLMQFMPATAREEAKRAGLSTYDLYNPSDSIRLGASHLATLGKSFARPEYVMAAYNAGSGNARKWLKDGGDRLDLAHFIERVTFTETNGYVQRVSANLEIYRRLYNVRK